MRKNTYVRNASPEELADYAQPPEIREIKPEGSPPQVRSVFNIKAKRTGSAVTEVSFASSSMSRLASASRSNRKNMRIEPMWVVDDPEEECLMSIEEAGSTKENSKIGEMSPSIKVK